MRNALVGGIIVLVVALLVWSGVHNLRTRRAAEAVARTQPMSIARRQAGRHGVRERQRRRRPARQACRGLHAYQQHGQAHFADGPEGQAGPAQFLGDLVHALQGRDAMV